MSKFGVLLLLFSLVWATLSQNDSSQETMDVFRLPCTTKPESYDLFLAPTMNGLESSFYGEVKIIIVAIESTNTITLNAKELDITKVIFSEFNGQPSNEIKVVEYTIVPKNEQIVIQLESDIIPNNKYMVTISFAGKMRNDNTGFFLASYIEDKVKKWIAVTKFEGPYARRNFPCFDEPALKACFSCSIVKPKDHIVLSNMPIKDIKKESNDVEIVYFETTPLMSVHLLTFFVGDYVTNNDCSKITHYTHKNLLNQIEFSSNEAPKRIKVMEDYTGIPYQLPKLDFLLIPDIETPLENWGINIYDEKDILVDEDAATKVIIASIVIPQQEAVQNWFGNLVTCEWWDYLWLHEGFASYFQYFAAAMDRKTLPAEEWFVLCHSQVAFFEDEEPRHALTSPIRSPDEIQASFDFINSSKAASILRMLKYVVTEKYFMLSLRDYLARKMYDVAKPDDLFESFDKILKEHNYNIGNELTVKEFMLNWTLQSGYPVLSIEKDEASNTFTVTQKQYLARNFNESDYDCSKLWHIGLTFTTDVNPDFTYCQPTVWTSKTSQTTHVPAPPNCKWYMFNIQTIGFYRVLYDKNNYLALIKQLNDDFNVIHVINRAQVLDDAFSLAQANLLDFSIALSLTTYLIKETDELPFMSLMNYMESIEHRMRRDKEASKKLQAYLGSLFGSIFNKIQKLVSDGNTEMKVTMAWNDISIHACEFGNADCEKKALEYFNIWLAGGKIPADIRQAAFSVGLKQNSDPEIFKKLFELYITTLSYSDKESAMFALASSRDKGQLIEFMNHIFDGPEGPIDPKEFPNIIFAISKNPLGNEATFEFLSSNFNKILYEFSPDGEDVILDIFGHLANTATDENVISKIKEFIDTFQMNDNLRVALNSIYDNYITNHVAWFEKNSGAIIKWLNNNCAL